MAGDPNVSATLIIIEVPDGMIMLNTDEWIIHLRWLASELERLQAQYGLIGMHLKLDGFHITKVAEQTMAEVDKIKGIQQ